MLNFQVDLRQVDLRYWDLESTIDHGLVRDSRSNSCPVLALFSKLHGSGVWEIAHQLTKFVFLVVFGRKLTKFQSEIMIL